MNRELVGTLRAVVRGVYDIQELRIQTGNRIVANFKSRMGQKPSKKEEESLDKEKQKILKDMRQAYKRLTDGVVSFPRKDSFQGDELISNYTELVLVAQYIDLLADEKQHFNRIQHVLTEFPIYTEWLESIRGVGPAMGGVMLSEFDITKAEYPSSLWAYAGLDVAKDGQGRSRKKEHLIDIPYIDKDGNDAIRKGITFNPFLKTKLVGVLGPSFIRLGGPYRDIYDNYKNRLENSPAHMEKTKKHRHNMAVRYMIKRFLVDLYKVWRKMEGLPVADEYSIAKLGLVHKKAV